MIALDNLYCSIGQKTRVAQDWMGQKSDLDIGEPGLHSLEALLHCNIVHHHHTLCLAKELLGYAAVPVSVMGSECQQSDLFNVCK